MKLSEEGIRHIQSEEGLRTNAYQDERGIWTIGYGHTGPEVKPGTKITVEEADSFFRRDIERFERAVQSAVTVDLTQKQYDSLVSFVYNVGEGNFTKSTLLNKLNSGDYYGASREFEKWTRAGDHVSKGLVSRRNREKRIFMGEDAYSSSRLADTGTGSSQKIGNSTSGVDDKLANTDRETLARLEALRQKVDAMPETVNEEEFVNRLRREGRGIG